MRKSSNKKPRYFIHSIAKGLSVLQSFSEAGHALKLSEIASALRVNGTTATRLCHTLRELGFIDRDSQKQYYPTPKVLTLGSSFVSGLPWQEIAKDYLEKLSKEVNSTAALSILSDEEILFVIRVRKREYLPFDIRIGTKLPVYCTAMGKVLMAMGPRETIPPILKKLKFKALTTHTITQKDKFLRELDMVRKNGYAINDEELTIGNRSIAAPVLDRDHNAIAAINIAFPTSMYSCQEMEKTFAPVIMRTATQISEALLEIESPIVMGKSV